MLTTITEKRPQPAYFPALEDVAHVFKRIRTDPVPPPNLIAFPALAGQPVDQGQRFPAKAPLANIGGSPLTHCIPPRFNPVLQDPFQIKDLFCDVLIAQSERQKGQLSQSIQCYPPPIAPMMANGTSSKAMGAMIPFIYPELPAIERDLLMTIPEDLRVTDFGDYLYPVIAPLPFPPPNYMPYPLVSDSALLTPSEVFALWLVALTNLPRVDMVLASAAGSIFDLRIQAQNEGLTLLKLDRMIRGGVKELGEDLLDVSTDGEDGLTENGLEQYLEYAAQVDTSDSYDLNMEPRKRNLLPIESITRIKYQQISPLVSKDAKIIRPDSRPSLEYSSRDLDKPEYKIPARFVPPKAKEYKDQKKLTKAYVSEVEYEAQKHRTNLYNTKKRKLLKRLENLQASKIFYDNTKREVYDDELSRYMDQRQAENDIELLRLKVQYTYDKVKALMAFYQTSHRLYKTMNAVLVNKFKKLKNFFEHQRQVLDDASSPRHAGEGDVISIKGREGAKLYSSFVEQDYSGEIKEVFRCAALRDEGEIVENDESLDPSMVSKVYLNREHEATVDDYMPLVTESEFKLVTGEAPSKTGVSKDLTNKTKVPRHLIFQNQLYDYGTSGSDTNLSENAFPAKRRPGRRAAPKPAYGEETTKQLNDAALVAKIMKLFVGPAGANADELNNDLTSIGIKTRWPL